MANETPHHKYRTVPDNPEPIVLDNPGCAKFVSGCLLIISIPFLLVTIVCFAFNWTVLQWIFLSISLLLVLWALKERFTFGASPNKGGNFIYKNPSKLEEAFRAKVFLGFDFGNEFTLRTTGSHDYAEILLDFTENGFAPLRQFCEKTTETHSRKDTDNEITITEIKKHIVIEEEFDFIGKPAIIKPGFTKKIERYYDAKSSDAKSDLFITSQLKLEVDFEARTLKMSFTGF